MMKTRGKPRIYRDRKTNRNFSLGRHHLSVLTVLARAMGISVSELMCRILDQALGLDGGVGFFTAQQPASPAKPGLLETSQGAPITLGGEGEEGSASCPK